MPSPLVHRATIAFAIVAMALAFESSASAQYFGRNKVHYKKLDFQVLKTEHFDIYFYPEEQEGVAASARLAERWLARLESLLGHKLRGRQPLVLYASHVDFEQTNAIPGELGEGTGGVTEPLRRRIVLPLGGPLADTDHVIGHELVHAFQFDITTNPNAPPGQNGAERLPLWFIEGMAEYLSLGPIDPNTAMWLRDAARQEKQLPAIEKLDDPKYFPYRWGQAFWAYVAGRFGDEVVHQMLSVGATTGDVNIAIERVLGVKTKELSDDWHEAIRRTYEPILAATTAPAETGRLVIKGREFGGDLNVGPAMSPDGRWIAFLSERELFSIDLYVADAASGKIIHKLTSTATDPHTSSIQFIYSAGAWDSTSSRIAIASVVSGRPALAIFNAQRGSKEREIPIASVDEIFNPTWAPDGHAICFTGMSRGLTDLYIYDLDTLTLGQLTHDPFADLQPAWSPDGRWIAFATDRFSTRLDMLAMGPYRLALVDPVSGRIEPVRAFAEGKNINPQWSPDSRSLYFISDRDGIPNVYRVTLDSGDIAQVTSVGTGISGITNSSPALSVAAKSGVAAFSVYEDGKYDIYAIDPPARGGRIGPIGAGVNAAVLPPVTRRDTELVALLANASFGLPPLAPDAYPIEPYKPSLSLEGIAQPTIAVGADRFGAAVGGGIAFQFADMLGDHVLMVAAQVDSGVGGSYSFNNTSAQAAYYNQAHRWNWGVVGGQIPYISGGFASDVRNVNGEIVGVDQSILFRQTERSAGGVVAYPFNRAQRIEFQGGVSRISFDKVTETTVYSLATGQIFSDDRSTTSIATPLNLATSSAALVFDTANFGATSPVQGQRYRFEAAPTFGSINFTSLLADYRRYFMPVSFYTVAGRLMHYGRYGSGGQDERLFPLFIGYPNLVRGYDVGTFNNSDCIPTPASQCPAFDQLLGSRVLIGNLEFRFPLLRPFIGVSQKMYGPIPVEVALFTDGGVAWDRGEKPSFFGGSRKGVASGGVAFRVNMFGFAVGEFDFARAFHRTKQGWVFQFNLSPGF